MKSISILRLLAVLICTSTALTGCLPKSDPCATQRAEYESAKAAYDAAMSAVEAAKAARDAEKAAYDKISEEQKAAGCPNKKKPICADIAARRSAQLQKLNAAEQNLANARRAAIPPRNVMNTKSAALQKCLDENSSEENS